MDFKQLGCFTSLYLIKENIFQMVKQEKLRQNIFHTWRDWSLTAVRASVFDKSLIVGASYFQAN